MTRKVVLVDVDGVLADLMTPFVELLNDLTGRAHTVSDITQYNLTKCIATPEEVAEVFDLMSSSRHDTFYDLPLYPGAKSFVDRTREEGWRLVALTAIEPRFAVARKYWLEKYLGFTSRDIILAHDKSLVQGDVLVEDCVDNLLTWPGATKILINQPWNQGTFPGVVRGSFKTDR